MVDVEGTDDHGVSFVGIYGATHVGQLSVGVLARDTDKVYTNIPGAVQVRILEVAHVGI